MTTAAPSERHLGLVGATGIGVGSMLGAGVFAVWAPAASAAGRWLVGAVVLAAVVAAINAFSTAQLAALHPVAGGVYTYGSRELAPVWGFVAGIGFVLGKTASVAAMALTIGAYAWPDGARPVAAVAVLAAWALNARGVTRTAAATTVIAGAVLVGLAVVGAMGWSAPAAAGPVPDGGVGGLLEAAALMFFAFAGYARLATLGEEVRDPRRTIPRAIGAAMIIVVTAYLALALTLTHSPGIEALAASRAPLADAVPSAGVWRAGVAVLAALAAGGAMLALLAGLGRTSMAMAREGDLPGALTRTNDRGVPAVAEAATALVAVGLAWWGDLGFALAMSSVSVLAYYGVANAAAFAAAGRARKLRVPRVVSALGLLLCAALAVSLPPAAIAAAASLGIVAVAIRAAVRSESRRRRRR